MTLSHVSVSGTQAMTMTTTKTAITKPMLITIHFSCWCNAKIALAAKNIDNE